MELNRQEALLDRILASPERTENGIHDGDWIVAAEQTEKQLAKELGSIDKETLIRLLAKSTSAAQKILTNETERNNRNLEQIVKQRIDEYHYWQGITDALPKAIRSAAARESANARHIETRANRQKVVDEWRTNISPDKSNEFAAEMLQKRFPEISHRTLAKYVAFAKKNAAC